MVSGCAWRRRGGGIPAVRGSGEDKGEVVGLSDKARGQGELAVDDHVRAAPSGHHHAEIGIDKGMPEPASPRLSSLVALKRKWLRH